ncbi:3-dehydroquinate synthase [Scopulibacillus darangshiensis]|uniref:3-dehydroquinate synthase n=1 Tax=Scopulibacillus darangshiensis TaxID=442528 RepID=A0A4R2PC33_9BACL|nr:3-dehydroquinate synthase [Scopulibacillus darangshiensis]TCP31641.1 3-dehydroquinate synthase [Scopulibacillus darangshiensis]
MDDIIIRTKTAAYPVYIGPNIRFDLTKLLPNNYKSYYIITDKHVGPLYAQDLTAALSGKEVYHYTIPASESAKSMTCYQAVLDDMLESHLDRGSCVIALGGGVVGDLAGFAAATYMRGIAFIQMPTTLLAHDSSVGGKVGINSAHGKNLIGAFYHPEAVIYDTSTLDSLPMREMQSGFVEVLKHSLIDSESFYLSLMEEIPDAASLTPKKVEPFIAKGIKVKAGIVREDEQEKGIRAHLNFGHTLGHAIEKELGFGQMTHGEAVGIGIVFAMMLSERHYHLSLPIKAFRKWLKALGLPDRVPSMLTSEALLGRMMYDKKNKDGRLRFVLMEKIGIVQTDILPKSLVEETLQDFMNET